MGSRDGYHGVTCWVEMILTSQFYNLSVLWSAVLSLNLIPDVGIDCQLFGKLIPAVSVTKGDVDGLGWYLRIFNLTCLKRSEAKVDLGGYFRNTWSDLWGKLWPLTFFGRSDWIFSNIIPNHPQVCNLKSFWHVFEVTSNVNFGLWPLLVGQIEYSQTSSQSIHHFLFPTNFWPFFQFQFSTCVRFPIITIHHSHFFMFQLGKAMKYQYEILSYMTKSKKKLSVCSLWIKKSAT